MANVHTFHYRVHRDRRPVRRRSHRFPHRPDANGCAMNDGTNGHHRAMHDRGHGCGACDD